MRFFKLLIIFVGSTVYAGQVFADIWQSALSSYLSEDYTANPALQPGVSTGVWLSTVSPGYTLNKTDGDNALKAVAKFTAVESSNKALSANRTDPSVALNWLRKYNTGEYGITTQYEQIATRTSVDTTSQFSVDSTQVRRSVSANWSDTLSERNTLTANGSYIGSNYSGGAYTNYSTRSGKLNYSHNLSETVVPSLSVAYTEMVFTANEPSVSTVNPMLSLEWKISQRMNSTLSLGETFSRTGNTPQFSSLLNYTGEKTNLTFTAGYMTSPSGLGGFLTSEHVTGGLTHNLSEQSTSGINLSWAKNLSITNDTYGTIDAWLQHEIDSSWNVKTHFLHKLHEGGGLGSASSNVIGISLNYTGSEF